MTVATRLRLASSGLVTVARPRIRLRFPEISQRWSQPLALGLTLLGLVLAFRNFYVLGQPAWHDLLGMDHRIYDEAVVRWLHGDGFYYPQQIAGPYVIAQGHVLYPPTALMWLLPGAFLPDIMWFGLPPLSLLAVIAWHRPTRWAWPAMAGLLAVTDTAQMLVSGTPTTWIAVAMAVGTLWRPAFALVLLKPTLLPFALLGLRHRGWWVVVAALAAMSLAMLPMWVDYLKVVMNARGPLATPLYSGKDVALVLIPIVAWVGGRRRHSVPAPDTPG
jgi:hypothetical protein